MTTSIDRPERDPEEHDHYSKGVHPQMTASDSERAQGRASITSILVPVDDLSAAIEFLRVEGGFELHWIHPADA
ncbi:MAG: hypothetical protein EBX99_03400, partial [Acidimicrobiia bacterium]|nr:hypothetical protein [Acidimicrobiia bacterium]